ncbi:MAG: RluA family pseudouridine synthase [Butyrivibrio sp.]|nr:RluA family pseudouridine synthase [Butyrivibrio sp.]
MRDIRYIYEDNDILVCHKPAGVATEGAKAYTMDLVSAARNYLARKDRKAGKPPYVATVHRLDQPVEGVVVLAKTRKAAGDISEQIKKRTTGKYYYALCYGVIPDERGSLTDYLIRKEDGFAAVINEKEKYSLKDGVITLDNGENIRTVAGDVKKAQLEYEVVKRTEETTLLRIKLLTGRFHQIRVQLSHLGYPILGEKNYGSEASVNYSQEMGIKDICLVSYKFELKHPVTKKALSFEINPDNPQIKSMLGE